MRRFGFFDTDVESAVTIELDLPRIIFFADCMLELRHEIGLYF